MKSFIVHLYCIAACSGLSCAWIARSGVKIENTRVSTSLHSKSSPAVDGNDFEDVSGRRKWLTTIGHAAIGAGCIPLLPANAVGLVSTASTCDQTVSVWKQNGRVIYLLGTAHISSSSAQLAGNLVREVHPNAVFVELDPKRVRGSGILANRVSVGENGEEMPSTSKVIVPQISIDSKYLASSAGTSGVSEAPQPAQPAAPQKVSPMMRAASAAVGSGIKGMYKKLDSAGFNAGEEFVVAIREGQKQNADIILGDRDVEVTLRRVTEGLAQTDLSELLNPDSELEKSMAELVPSKMAQGGTTGDLSNDEVRQEFSAFVETMKAKENVKKIMGQLQKSAPALYQALVSERDAYMAAGLNGLNEFEAIVAVMGIAHVDGVEQNLRENGWQAIQPTCSTK